jgi:hypothetical protein
VPRSVAGPPRRTTTYSIPGDQAGQDGPDRWQGLPGEPAGICGSVTRAPGQGATRPGLDSSAAEVYAIIDSVPIVVYATGRGEPCTT